MPCRTAALSAACLIFSASATAAEVPRAPEPPVLVLSTVIVETADQSDPAVLAWAAKIDQELNEQYAPIMALLPGGAGGERHVELRLERSPDGIAATAGDVIHCNLNWFMPRTMDVGALIHELAHVVQSYPGYEFWLTEGIADWVRNFNYEGDGFNSFKGQGAGDYRSGYRDAARFLEWLRVNKQADIIPVMNQLLRENKYDAGTYWTQHCGAELDALWTEYTKWWEKQ